MALGDVAVGLGQVLGGPLDPVLAARGYCLLVFPEGSLDVMVVGPDGVVLLVLALPLLRPVLLLALVLLGDSVVGCARAVGGAAEPSLLFVLSLVPPAAALILLPGVGVAGARLRVVAVPRVPVGPPFRVPGAASAVVSVVRAVLSVVALADLPGGVLVAVVLLDAVLGGLPRGGLGVEVVPLPVTLLLPLPQFLPPCRLVTSCLLAATSCLTLSTCSAACPWCSLLA